MSAVRCILLFLALVAASAAAAAQDEVGFVRLSDDPTMSQWTVVGADSWSCVDGAIYCNGDGSGWLRSDRVYGDFDLRLEYRVAQGANSGVFLRAPLRGRQSARGMELQIMGIRSDPPQAESNGSIYDAAPAMVDPSHEPGEWNELRAVCEGPLVRVWVNGEQTHDINVDTTPLNDALPRGRKLSERNRRGFIGLQNHGGEVWFRNVRILATEDGFEPLLTPGSYEGWEMAPDAPWRVEGEALTHDAVAVGSVHTTRDLGNFVVRFEYQVAEGAEAGVILREVEGNRTRIEIGLAGGATPTDLNSPGALRGYAAPSQPAALPPGQWNDMEIRYEDCWLEVLLNGVRVLNCSIFEPGGFYRPPMQGRLTFESRSGAIAVRSIRVQELPQSDVRG